jgi:hypothetical protein
LWYILSWADFGDGGQEVGKAGLNRRAKRARIARSARAVWFNHFFNATGGDGFRQRAL